jgi:acyl-CoA thioesterase
VGQIDDETAIHADGDGTYRTHLTAAWNIGANPNGGYAMFPALRAAIDLAQRPDPVSMTVHYLRPATPDGDGTVAARVVRVGRSGTYVTASLEQEGTPRLTVAAILGDLSVPVSDAPDPGLVVAAPEIPPPAACVDRLELDQGVELSLLSRVDVRVRRDAVADDGDAATVDGWVRLRDGTAPTAACLPLFADAFPPAVHARIGRVGWVPTLELTVHVRRRPVEGWVQARLTCDDVAGGWMVETGSLWDESGALVARSRQLGMLLSRSGSARS